MTPENPTPCPSGWEVMIMSLNTLGPSPATEDGQFGIDWVADKGKRWVSRGIPCDLTTKKVSSVKEYVLRELMAQILIRWIAMSAPSLKITAISFPRPWPRKMARRIRVLCSLHTTDPYRYKRIIHIDWLIEAGFIHWYGRVILALKY